MGKSSSKGWTIIKGVSVKEKNLKYKLYYYYYYIKYLYRYIQLQLIQKYTAVINVRPDLQKKILHNSKRINKINKTYKKFSLINIKSVKNVFLIQEEYCCIILSLCI